MVWRKLIVGQEGQVLPLALAFWAIGMLLIPLCLSYMNTGLIVAQSQKQVTVRQYAADAGVEDAIWRLIYEDGFRSSFTEDNPTTSYAVPVGSTQVNVTINLISSEEVGPQSWRVAVDYEVVDEGNNIFTYTIIIENAGTSAIHLTQIGDIFPYGFHYAEGGIVSGITTAEPEVSADGRQVIWNFDTPQPTISAGETKTQSFQAIADSQHGSYNECWIVATPESIGEVSSSVGSRFDIEAQIDGNSIIRASVAFDEAQPMVLSWQMIW